MPFCEPTSWGVQTFGWFSLLGDNSRVTCRAKSDAPIGRFDEPPRIGRCQANSPLAFAPCVQRAVD
jgi:hypothetical protein